LKTRSVNWVLLSVHFFVRRDEFLTEAVGQVVNLRGGWLPPQLPRPSLTP
jgi:hypothetical protein